MTDLAIAFRFPRVRLSVSGLSLNNPTSFATVTQVACPASVIATQPIDTAKKISNISMTCLFAVGATFFAVPECGNYFKGPLPGRWLRKGRQVIDFLTKKLRRSLPMTW